MSGVDAIEAYVRDYFHAWGIELPQESLAAREGGHIFESGWHIGYVWGIENGDEYLDLAQHRMTNDRNFRAFASGRVESMPAPPAFVVYPREATEGERQKLDDEYVETNRRVHADLRERGLLPPQGGNLAILTHHPGRQKLGKSLPCRSQ